jgi:hypothetical protein
MRISKLLKVKILIYKKFDRKVIANNKFSTFFALCDKLFGLLLLCYEAFRHFFKGTTFLDARHLIQ